MERKHVDETDVIYSKTGSLISCLSSGEDAVSIVLSEINHTSVLFKDHASSLLLDFGLRINILGCHVRIFAFLR